MSLFFYFIQQKRKRYIYFYNLKKIKKNNGINICIEKDSQ